MSRPDPVVTPEMIAAAKAADPLSYDVPDGEEGALYGAIFHAMSAAAAPGTGDMAVTEITATSQPSPEQIAARMADRLSEITVTERLWAAMTICSLVAELDVYKRATEALSALQSPSAPAEMGGWKLVPIEPTEAMIEAMKLNGWDDPDHEAGRVGHSWVREAMYTAAISAVGTAPRPECDWVLVPYDDFYAAYGFVPRSKLFPDSCLKTRLRALLREEDLAHADEAEAALDAEKDEIARLTRERDDLYNELGIALDRKQAFAETVDRVWKALGSPEYETLGGKTISEVVADYVARATAAEGQVAALVEGLTVVASRMEVAAADWGIAAALTSDKLTHADNMAEWAKEARSLLARIQPALNGHSNDARRS